MTISNDLPVAVIGAGPVGLAAAAHLLQRGETPLVLEAGAEIGANIRQWQHVRMFSPWEFTVDRATVALLEPSGWQMPPATELPTGRDLLERYMLPFAELPVVRKHIHLNARVVAISRRNIDKMKDAGREDAAFIIHVVYGDGSEKLLEARAVIDASGTWHNPNPLGSGGLAALGERAGADHIFYGIPDVTGDFRTRYANKRVLVVGSGHSAINALLDLSQLQAQYPDTQIIWALRSTNFERIYGGQADDALPARGELGTRIQQLVNSGAVQVEAPFRIEQLQVTTDGLLVTGATHTDQAAVLLVDEIIATTGARPDLEMLRELRLTLDPSLESPQTLGPLIDPNIHSCGTVPPHGEAELRHPEKDFYIVGMKSYGRAPTFLLATGYEQVRSVVAALVGDWEAAESVELNLPETGVCSTNLSTNETEAAACCGSTSIVPDTIPLAVLQPVSLPAEGGLQPVAVAVETKACGCDDTCCADGERSTTCGCDASCC